MLSRTTNARWSLALAATAQVAVALVLLEAAAVASLPAHAGDGAGGSSLLPTSTPTKVTLTWFGQSCFLLETAAGTRVLIDPIAKGTGYELPAGLRADVVTVSHEHADHNNVALVTGRARVLRGLTADKKGWTKIEEKVRDVSIRTVGVYHDDKQGAERGLDTVFIFEVGGLRIAHLGDLGHVLDDAQQSAIGSVDVVLVPVGGAVTIDAERATRVIDQLRPRLVIIPMHYRTAVSTNTQLATVDEFLAGKTNVRRLGGNVLRLTAVKTRPAAEIVVMGYKPPAPAPDAPAAPGQ
jgi:L-ascorbate metabolism protein UlaG (beta-lactamase superfamily)